MWFKWLAILNFVFGLADLIAFLSPVGTAWDLALALFSFYCFYLCDISYQNYLTKDVPSSKAEIVKLLNTHKDDDRE